MSRVVITICTYRAETTLAKTIEGIPDGVADELIVVDDASPDGTADLARSLGVRVIQHPENRGYGASQKTGYTTAISEGAEYVALLHGDYQYDPRRLPLLLAPLQTRHADMTFGSRFASMSDPRQGGMPWYRYFGNRITTGLQNALLGTRFTDWHSGLRAFNRDCLLALPFLGYPDGFPFDTYATADTVALAKRVVEIPIDTRYDAESSSINIVDSFGYTLDSIKIVASRAWRGGRRRNRRASDNQRFARARSRSQPPEVAINEALAAFYVPNRRVVVTGDSPAPGDQWTRVSPGDSANAGAVIVSPGTSDAATELKRVASSVTADALILISSGSPKVTVPEGFKIVTWYRGVAVVRPVSPSN